MNRTTIQCPICKQFVTWEKVDFTRPDLAFDWKLQILCGCGPVKDLDVIHHCESLQKIEAYAKVWGKAALTTRQILGDELDDCLNKSITQRHEGTKGQK